MGMRRVSGGSVVYSLAVAGFLSFFLSGCVATSQEMGDLREDIYQLQLKLNEVQRNQADIASKMDTFGTNMKSLSLDDLESNLSQSMNKLSQQLSGSALSVPPPPSEVYRIAYSDFSKGKYELAVTGFRTYLEKYPQGELADQAQYYIGECYYSQSDWNKALEEFDAVEKNFPRSNLIPAARLKYALSLEQKGETQ